MSKKKHKRHNHSSLHSVPSSNITQKDTSVLSSAWAKSISAKAKEGNLIIVDEAKLSNPKTKELLAKLNVCGLNNCLFIDGKEVDLNFALASRNIVGVDVLPTIGANVYDILKKEKLVLTKDAVACLEERLQ